MFKGGVQRGPKLLVTPLLRLDIKVKCPTQGMPFLISQELRYMQNGTKLMENEIKRVGNEPQFTKILTKLVRSIRPVE